MLSTLFVFRKRLPRRTEIILGIIGFTIFLTTWHLIAISGVIRPEFLPTPWAVAQAFVSLFTERDFAADIGISVARVWFAFFLAIIVPAALPNMVDNLRITLGWCWTYLIVAEIVAANSGIGHVIWSLRRFVKTPEVMAGIIAIGIIGLLTDQAFRFAHARLFSYQDR